MLKSKETQRIATAVQCVLRETGSLCWTVSASGRRGPTPGQTRTPATGTWRSSSPASTSTLWTAEAERWRQHWEILNTPVHWVAILKVHETLGIATQWTGVLESPDIDTFEKPLVHLSFRQRKYRYCTVLNAGFPKVLMLKLLAKSSSPHPDRYPERGDDGPGEGGRDVQQPAQLRDRRARRHQHPRQALPQRGLHGHLRDGARGRAQPRHVPRRHGQ